MAVALALAAALCNALATIFERIGVETAPEDSSMRWKLMAHVLRRPTWWLGLLSMLGAFGFQVAALDQGGLTLVQPLLVTELIFLALVLRFWFGRPLGWREAFGVVLTVAGLATFLAISNQGGGSLVPDQLGWLLMVIATVGAAALCVSLARVGSRPWRSAWYGAAAAIAFAVSAAFMKASTVLVHRGGLPVLFTHFEPYGIAVAGLAGLFLAQNAFLAGPITASQASLVIVDPLASIIIGVGLFGDNLRGGIGALALDAATLALMSLGLVVLCHSPLIVNTSPEDRLVRASHRVAREAQAS
ncbi:MAG: DMT family transporter [Actinomycetota bacterium]|jgi:drug/metabolite transporter (DMT)-like permease|nr:DMT family transporter [Actinomycetota bacterium]